MAFKLHGWRPTQAIVNLDHLAHNYQVLRAQSVPGQFFCPIIKANAYGHGDVESAVRLQQEGANILGVALIEEAILLRQMGIRCEILVLGLFDRQGATEILRHNLTPTISGWDQLLTFHKEIERAQDRTLPIPVHIKFDTGMHRLGFDWIEANAVFEFCLKHKDVLKVGGIFTHLHSAEDAFDSNGRSFEQLVRFKDVEKVFAPLQPQSHTLNSAGIINFAKQKNKFSMPGISPAQGARPGLALYGVSPIVQNELDLKPVMSLRTQIVQTHQVGIGEGVSYGHTWKARRKSAVAILPIGYADGYHRALSNTGQVIIENQLAPVIGTVCMDFIIVDITDIVRQDSLEHFLGREVTLFGSHSRGQIMPVEQVAAAAKTVAWEILTSVSERVPRVFVGLNQTSRYNSDQGVLS